MDSVRGRRCRLALGCCVRLLSELAGRCLRRLRVAMAGPPCVFWFGENMATAGDGKDVCYSSWRAGRSECVDRGGRADGSVAKEG